MTIKGVLLDLSGTLYVGNDLLPGVKPALQRLLSSSLPVRFVTNTSRSTRRQVHDKLRKMGLDLSEEHIFTAPRAVYDYLLNHQLRPWLLVHPNLEDEFADLNGDNPNAVVLGDAGPGFTYDRLNQAFRLLLDGASLLAVGDNRYFREPDGLSLDAGPFIKALEYAAGIRALILGKPSREFFDAAVSHLACRPEEALMVGDDVFADVKGALNAGLQGALVQTGKYRPGDEKHIVVEGGRCFRNLEEVVRKMLA
jgi:HAD superfamily hydrolase (TIGR01458 family)